MKDKKKSGQPGSRRIFFRGGIKLVMENYFNMAPAIPLRKGTSHMIQTKMLNL